MRAVNVTPEIALARQASEEGQAPGRLRLPALSLRKLALAYALGALLLVLITVAIGGTGLYLWQQASRESVRINSLVEETQGMRGSLYRQMKEVFDALFLHDPDAAVQYRTQQQEVEARLAVLRTLVHAAVEREAIQRLARPIRISARIPMA
jgi:hypothetical protein